VFAVLHLGYKSALDMLFVFGVAIGFGLLTLYTGSILGSTLAHGLTNIALFLIFPFLVGGPTQPAQASIPNQATATVIVTVAPTQMPLAAIGTTSTPFLIEAVTGTATSTATPAPTLTATLRDSVTPSLPAATLVVATKTAAVAPIIVNEGDPSFARSGGYWWKVSEGFRGDLVWAYTAQSVASASVEWDPGIAGCGRYTVEVYVPADYSTTHRASYALNSTAGEQVVVVDQASLQGGWVRLGEYDFDVDQPYYLKLNNVTGELDGEFLITFDAARWTYLGSCGR
jgi:hypothetical protein